MKSAVKTVAAAALALLAAAACQAAPSDGNGDRNGDRNGDILLCDHRSHSDDPAWPRRCRPCR
jgi:hypothetical protein